MHASGNPSTANIIAARAAAVQAGNRHHLAARRDLYLKWGKKKAHISERLRSKQEGEPESSPPVDPVCLSAQRRAGGDGVFSGTGVAPAAGSVSDQMRISPSIPASCSSVPAPAPRPPRRSGP